MYRLKIRHQNLEQFLKLSQFYAILIITERSVFIKERSNMKTTEQQHNERRREMMEKVEDDFMEMAPTDPKDVVRFVKEVPYWTAKKHGKKFFEGVNECYTEYAKRLEPKIGIPYTVITPLIYGVGSGAKFRRDKQFRTEERR